MGRGRSVDSSLWPGEGPYRAFLQLLDRVHRENGTKSLADLAAAMNLRARSRVSALLRGQALPADDDQARDLIRALGGSSEDEDRGLDLYRRARSSSSRVVHPVVLHPGRRSDVPREDIREEGGQLNNYGGSVSYTGTSSVDARTADLVPSIPTIDVDAYMLGVAIAALPTGSKQKVSNLELTPYIERPHDAVLRGEISRATAGASLFLLLTGDSATGKTRALYEAMRSNQELHAWPLFRPIDACELNALLDQGRVAAGTVLWLNETQKYLYGGDGERASRLLIRLLETKNRVIILGAMWQSHYDELTATGRLGDPVANARELLMGYRTRKILTPNAMTPAEINAMAAQPSRDRRLAIAVASSGDDGEVIQHLTGGPELVEGYLDGGLFNPVERAVITAAMEARRLGHVSPIPAKLLEEAANGYLTGRQRPGNQDWAVAALNAITSGTRADNTRTDVRRTLKALTEYRSRAGQSEVAYEPNSFLDQNTRAQRADTVGPYHLWSALADNSATADDLHSVGNAAQLRGLFRHAAKMWLRAVRLGKSTAAAPLLRAVIRIEDEHLTEAADWMVENTPLDNPRAADSLIRALNQAGRGDVVPALSVRAAGQVTLGNLRAVASLLRTFAKYGADRAIAILAERAADEGSIDSPRAIVDLLGVLSRLGVENAVAILATRASLDVTLDSPRGVALLIKNFSIANAEDAATKLAVRAAKDIQLESPRAIAHLLREFRQNRSSDALAALVARHPASKVSLNSFTGVCALIREFGESGYGAEATSLTMRALDYPYDWNLKGTSFLVRTLHESQLGIPVELRERLASFENGAGINELTCLLRAAGVDQTIADSISLTVHMGSAGNMRASFRILADSDGVSAIHALAVWVAYQVPVDNPRTVAGILEALRQFNQNDAAITLAFRAARKVPLEDSRGICCLLKSIKDAAADIAASTLATRSAENIDLDSLQGIAELLTFFVSFEFHKPLNVLISRNPAATVCLKGAGLGRLARALQEAGDTAGAADLLRRAVDSGSPASEYLFDAFVKSTARPNHVQQIMKYGREPDGTPSRPWGWRDLS